MCVAVTAFLCLPHTATAESGREGDWTLPEAERFSQSFELKDTNILPNPTVMDSGGDFIYRPEAADAMKSELLKGHAIAITYYADQSMPEMSREDLRAILENALYAYGDYYTEEDIEFYLDAATGVTDLSALSREELEYLIKLRAFINDIADLPYDLSAMRADELILIFQSRVFGAPYDELVADAGRDGYLSFIGEDPVIYAQYTYQMEASNHAACIVGWDDTCWRTTRQKESCDSCGRRRDYGCVPADCTSNRNQEMHFLQGGVT